MILSKDRSEGIYKAVNNGFDTVILDDGFQDYKIKKTLSIICFNEKQLIGNGLVFPAGPLRENIKSISSANIIIINGEKNKEFEKKY